MATRADRSGPGGREVTSRWGRSGAGVGCGKSSELPVALRPQQVPAARRHASRSAAAQRSSRRLVMARRSPTGPSTVEEKILMSVRRYAWLLSLEVLLLLLVSGKHVAAEEPVQRVQAADVWGGHIA